MILTPRPYQQQGIDFLLDHKHGALWDSPGLGKTLQASEVFINYLPATTVCPTYLTWQWYDFLTEQYPGLSVLVAEGNALQKSTSLLLAKPDVYITNIEAMRKYPMPTRSRSFVIDEAHRVKGRNAQQSKAALLYAQHPNRTIVVQLTATPMRREADDLFMQLRILDPREFTSYHRFINEFCNVQYLQGFRTVIKGISKPKALQALTARYALSRTYQDVGLAVPPLVTNVLYPSLTPTELKRYRAIRKQYRDDQAGKTFSNAFQVIDHLRHLTFHQVKIDAIKALLVDNGSTSKGGGFLVYCKYVDHAKQLAQALNAVCITGEMPASERIPRAKHSKRVVCTHGALSEGGNLTHLKTLIYAEQDYTEDTQTTGRVVRPTEDLTPVLRYDVVLKGTIDEVIYKCRTRRVTDAQEICRLALGDDDD